jgi:hypothetical protein
MTTKDYLIAARAKIADESNWAAYALARDAEGTDKPSSHPLAGDPHWEGIDGRSAGGNTRRARARRVERAEYSSTTTVPSGQHTRSKRQPRPRRCAGMF